MPAYAIKKTLEERLLEKRLIDPATGCWIYLGGTNPDGYGWMSYNHHAYTAHRLSAHVFLGLDLYDTKQIACHRDDLCKRKNCFNPDHLYIGTRYTNGRDRGKIVTHCPQGHEYTKENTLLIQNRKNCRICAKASKARWKERQV